MSGHDHDGFYARTPVSLADYLDIKWSGPVPLWCDKENNIQKLPKTNCPPEAGCIFPFIIIIIIIISLFSMSMSGVMTVFLWFDPMIQIAFGFWYQASTRSQTLCVCVFVGEGGGGGRTIWNIKSIVSSSCGQICTFFALFDNILLAVSPWSSPPPSLSSVCIKLTMLTDQ